MNNDADLHLKHEKISNFAHVLLGKLTLNHTCTSLHYSTPHAPDVTYLVFLLIKFIAPTCKTLKYRSAAFLDGGYIATRLMLLL